MDSDDIPIGSQLEITPFGAKTDDSVWKPIGVWKALVRHSRHVDTLQPGVSVIVAGPDGGYALELSVELAEQVAEQIVEQAKIARANHWE